MTDPQQTGTERCEWCNGALTGEYEMVDLRPPAYYVEMPTGMPHLLFEDYARAYENATGELIDDNGHEDDEHPEEWRIHLVDSDGSMEVPVVDI